MTIAVRASRAVLAAFLSALSLSAEVPAAHDPWIDCGAGMRPRARQSALSAGLWMDAGVALGPGGEGRENFEALRWSAWKAGALLSAEWLSYKLSDWPGAPYDTWLLAFSGEGGSFSGVREYVRGASGASELAEYGIFRGEGLLILSRRNSGSLDLPQPFATLTRKGDSWEVSTAAARILYSRTSSGGLRIERDFYGTPEVEEYGRDGRALFSKGGVVEARGFFVDAPGLLARWAERRVGDTEGLEQTEFDYLGNTGGRLSVGISGVEPIGEASIEGAASIGSGDRGFENFVIADLVLGPDRRATPILAWAYLGKIPPRLAEGAGKAGDRG